MTICFWKGAVTSRRRIACRQQPFFRTTAAGSRKQCFSWTLVGLDGLEPSTSRLSGARSNHLSYRPLFLRWSLIRVHLGGDEGNRTLDPLLAGQVLSQLSYTPIRVRSFWTILKNWTARGYQACAEPLINWLNLFPNTEVFLRSLPDSP